MKDETENRYRKLRARAHAARAGSSSVEQLHEVPVERRASEHGERVEHGRLGPAHGRARVTQRARRWHVIVSRQDGRCGVGWWISSYVGCGRVFASGDVCEAWRLGSGRGRGRTRQTPCYGGVDSGEGFLAGYSSMRAVLALTICVNFSCCA